METKITKETVNYIDLWYQVHYEYPESRQDHQFLDFTIFRITATYDEGFDSKLHVDDQPETKVELAEEYMVKGRVKWDGCLDMNFNSDDCIHFCGLHNAKQFGEVFLKIYEKADSIGCEIN